MTTSLYWQCVLGYMLGMLFHLFAVKIPSARRSSLAANKAFHVKEYLLYDWPAIVSNILAGAIGVYLVDDLIKWKPSALNTLRVLMACFGFVGSSLLIALFGAYSKYVLRVIDVKTNISDSVIPITSNEANEIGKQTSNPETQVAAAAVRAEEAGQK
jgi:hypothetical protein